MLPDFDSYTWDSPLFPKLCTELLRIEDYDKQEPKGQLVNLVFSFLGLSMIAPLEEKKAKSIRTSFHRRLLRKLKKIEDSLPKQFLLNIIDNEFEETLDTRDKTGELLGKYKLAVRKYFHPSRAIDYRKLVRQVRG